MLRVFVFFFQAEDGIRYGHVTGVQTCALPIYFVKTMLKLADTRSEVSVVSDQVGSPAFTMDVVMKSMKLLENEQIGTFHCSSEGKISWADFAEAIFTFSGKQTAVKRISTAEYKTDAKRPELSLLSKQELKLAGLQPLNWQVGLRGLLRELE